MRDYFLPHTFICCTTWMIRWAAVPLFSLSSLHLAWAAIGDSSPRLDLFCVLLSRQDNFLSFRSVALVMFHMSTCANTLHISELISVWLKELWIKEANGNKKATLDIKERPQKLVSSWKAAEDSWICVYVYRSIYLWCPFIAGCSCLRCINMLSLNQETIYRYEGKKKQKCKAAQYHSLANNTS